MGFIPQIRRRRRPGPHGGCLSGSGLGGVTKEGAWPAARCAGAEPPRRNSPKGGVGHGGRGAIQDVSSSARAINVSVTIIIVFLIFFF